MKRSIVISCALASLLANSVILASPRTDRLMKSADQLNLDETQLSRLRAACESYETAESNLKQVAKFIGIDPKSKSKARPIKANLVPKELRELEQAAKKYHNRFQFLDKTIKRWGPSTNMTARAARQSALFPFPNPASYIHRFAAHTLAHPSTTQTGIDFTPTIQGRSRFRSFKIVQRKEGGGAGEQ